MQTCLSIRHLPRGGGYVTPNLCLLTDTKDVVLEPKKNIVVDTRPPESTTFEFPLYLNTEIDYINENYASRFRGYDNILGELITWLNNNSIKEEGVRWFVPEEKLMENKIYIDGNLVISADTQHLRFEIGGDLYFNETNYEDYSYIGCTISLNGLIIDLYK